jgi:hypothetical protein
MGKEVIVPTVCAGIGEKSTEASALLQNFRIRSAQGHRKGDANQNFLYSYRVSIPQ